MPWLPGLVVLPIALSGMKKKRMALPLIFSIYYIVMIISIILPPFITMTSSGQVDPELVASTIAEDIVSGILLSLLTVTLLVVCWAINRRAELK
ncbi:MAG: hypothetical protein ABJN69_15335 [Hellea sp.]